MNVIHAKSKPYVGMSSQMSAGVVFSNFHVQHRACEIKQRTGGRLRLFSSVETAETLRVRGSAFTLSALSMPCARCVAAHRDRAVVVLFLARER